MKKWRDCHHHLWLDNPCGLLQDSTHSARFLAVGRHPLSLAPLGQSQPDLTLIFCAFAHTTSNILQCFAIEYSFFHSSVLRLICLLHMWGLASVLFAIALNFFINFSPIFSRHGFNAQIIHINSLLLHAFIDLYVRYSSFHFCHYKKVTVWACVTPYVYEIRRVISI